MGKKLPLIFTNIGLTALIAQIIFLRELITVFYGNELSIGIILGTWLFWTASGSWITGKLASRFKDSLNALSNLIFLNIFIIPLSIIAIRNTRNLFNTAPGEIIGLIPIFISSLLFLAPFCLINGSLFSLCSLIYSQTRQENPETAIGRVYFWEGFGAGTGGLISSFILIKYLNSIQISLLLSTLNLIIFLVIRIKQRWIHTKYCTVLSGGLFFIIIAIFISPYLNHFTNNLLWKNLKLEETRNSIYGNITVTSSNDQYNFYENGLFLFATGDIFSAEESIHFPLLEHPSPENILLIGGGLNGSIEQVLKHPTVEKIDYIELDPEIIEMGKKYSTAIKETLSHEKVNVFNGDGRFFIRQTENSYDVIIVNLPEPYTIQLNRFYTKEFFNTVQKRLNEGGVFSLSLVSSENVIGDILSEFLSIILKTLQNEFLESIIIPGNVNHFISANKEGVLTENYNTLISRLKNRDITNHYINEYYLPFRLAKDRIEYIKGAIEPDKVSVINSDFEPIAYYYDLLLWSTHFSNSFKEIFLGLKSISNYYYYLIILVCSFIVIIFCLFSGRRIQAGIPFSVAVVGFTGIALELILIFGFQIIYGYIYYEISILLACFMVGLCLGSYYALRIFRKTENVYNKFVLTQGFIAIIPLVIFLFLRGAPVINSQFLNFLISKLFFPFLVMTCGFLGGLHFTLSNNIFLKGKQKINFGILYAVDLIGSCLGALLVTSILIPLIGINKINLFICYFNGVALLVLFIIMKRHKPR